MSKYINPYTDFGFKKLFGEEASQDLLMDFLNELLPPEHKIAELSFQNPENQSKTETERKAIFDIYCTTSDGHAFIVEMQKAKMKFFKDRTLFYASFPIQAQAQMGDWNFELKPIYCVAIMDFEFEKKNNNYLSNVNLKDQYCELFYDKLHFIFVEMPRFKKTEDELTTHFEKWLYFLKNLTTFDALPDILKEPIFEKGMHIAEIAHYSPKEYEEYRKSLLTYLELKEVINTSFEDGIEEGEKLGIEKGVKIGIEEGVKLGIEQGGKNKAVEMVLVMHKAGEALEKIALYTGFTIAEIMTIIKSDDGSKNV